MNGIPMNEARLPDGTDRRDLSRRDFVKTVGTAALAATVPPSAHHASRPRQGRVRPARRGRRRPLLPSLRDDQRRRICFPFDHPKRSQVQNNWAVVEPTIGDMTSEQQALCAEVFQNLCSEDGRERFSKQMQDDYGGFENYHVAVFGEPGPASRLEWVLTGRHLTLRADGRERRRHGLRRPDLLRARRRRPHPRGPGTRTTSGGIRASRQPDFRHPRRRPAHAGLISQARADAARSAGSGRRLGDPGLAVGELDPQQKRMVQQLLKDLTAPSAPST
jgi:hypothetical protein